MGTVKEKSTQKGGYFVTLSALAVLSPPGNNLRRRLEVRNSTKSLHHSAATLMGHLQARPYNPSTSARTLMSVSQVETREGKSYTAWLRA